MKIFIVNKKYFDEVLADKAKFVHQNLYNNFVRLIATKGDVKNIFVTIDHRHESVAHFQFSHSLGEVYFFNFISTVS